MSKINVIFKNLLFFEIFYFIYFLINYMVYFKFVYINVFIFYSFKYWVFIFCSGYGGGIVGLGFKKIFFKFF